jgi:hypothetical protein
MFTTRQLSLFCEMAALTKLAHLCKTLPAVCLMPYAYLFTTRQLSLFCEMAALTKLTKLAHLCKTLPAT